MQSFQTISALQHALDGLSLDQSIAFVPTMGNLHQGHLALVEKAKTLADIVVVSIFVNPLQFGANEDLARYPRTLDDDQQKLEQAGVDYLFIPTAEEIYPNGQNAQSTIHVPLLGEHFCGASRPGHFDGVCTVVNKLLHIVQPDVAIFGEKDFQQLAIIRKMVADFCLPIEIIGVPIYRDEDGLALSSRNQYLSVTERNTAPLLYRTLQHCAEQMAGKNPSDFEAILAEARKNLTASGFIVDYLAVCDANTLAHITDKTQHLRLLAAAVLGSTRLIDNVHLSLNHLAI